MTPANNFSVPLQNKTLHESLPFLLTLRDDRAVEERRKEGEVAAGKRPVMTVTVISIGCIIPGPQTTETQRIYLCDPNLVILF